MANFCKEKQIDRGQDEPDDERKVDSTEHIKTKRYKDKVDGA